MYPILFADLNKPRTLVNCINGVWYDEKMQVVEKNETALRRVLESESSFIIKPTTGSCSGRGVKKITVANESNLLKILQGYGDYFICQSVVKQSPQTAIFNPDSLNTFRISSLNINGKCTAVSRMFRHGQKGFCFDNASAGGNFVGVDKDGNFTPFAWNEKYDKVEKTSVGAEYKDVKIEGFANLIATIEQAHKNYLPNMGFIGWDFALEENNKPVFIECNLGYPSILFEQLSESKPIFADRTDEVYEYTKQHMHKLNPFVDFVGSAL